MLFKPIKILFSTLAIMLVTLTGCTSFGDLKGLDQYIAVTSAEVKTAYQAVGIAFDANQIDQAEANRLLDRVDTAADAVETANNAYNAGENAKGAGELAAVKAILEVVRAAIPPPDNDNANVIPLEQFTIAQMRKQVRELVNTPVHVAEVRL